MVVKVYVSGISGNKEVKKRQQRVLMILDSKNIKYDVIDITEPGKENEKDFMQNNSTSNGGTVSDPNPRSPLPPQLFNDDEYCGDYDQFDLANEVDTLEQFLKLEVPPEPVESEKESTVNGDVNKASKENSQERNPETEKAVDADVSNEDKEKSPEVSDKVASKEATPARDVEKEKSVKEGSPTKDEEIGEEDNLKKEESPERQASVEKDALTKEESPSKEVEPAAVAEEAPADSQTVNENGTVSSREPSQEKAVNNIESKNPSELLIESEKAATAE